MLDSHCKQVKAAVIWKTHNCINKNTREPQWLRSKFYGPTSLSTGNMNLKGKRPNIVLSLTWCRILQGVFSWVSTSGVIHARLRSWNWVEKSSQRNLFKQTSGIWVADDSVNPSFVWVMHHTKTQEHWSKICQKSVDLCAPIDRTVDRNFNQRTTQHDG